MLKKFSFLLFVNFKIFTINKKYGSSFASNIEAEWLINGLNKGYIPKINSNPLNY